MTRHFPRSLWVALAGAALFLAALCWLPYRVALSPSVSDSFYFGYNNRVAELLIVAAAVLLAFFGPQVHPALSPVTDARKGLNPSVLWRWLAATFLLAALVQLLAHRLDGFGEGIYLIDRVKLAMAGRRPYFDFEYPYGAFFLYGPAWIARALRLSAGDGYALFWIANCLAGTSLLYLTLRWLDIPEAKQRGVFVFFSTYGLLMMFADGVNYTLFRYITPCFFAVWLYRLRKRRPSGERNALAMLAAMPCTVALLLISPELAISFGVGVAAYFVFWGNLRKGRHLLCFAAMLAGLAVVAWAASRFGTFVTMKTYSTGAYNLPVIPGPHILLFFFAVATAACYVGTCLRRRTGSALLILISVSAVGLAGALGRCDRVHTLMNPLGIVLAAALLESASPWLHRAWWWAVWFVFFWMMLPGLFTGMETVFGKILIQDYLALQWEGRWPAIDRWILQRAGAGIGPELAQRKLADMRALIATHGAIDINQTFGLTEGTISEAPFGFSPSRFGTFQTPELDEGYFFEHQNMGIPAAVERKIDEMRRHPERPLLLLPDRQITCVLIPEVERGMMRSLFTFPYDAEARNPVSVTEPLCAFIRDNYRQTQAPSPEHFDYAVWEHK